MKKMNSTSFWSKNISWKKNFWTKTFRKIKRNETRKFCWKKWKKMLKDRLKDRMIERDDWYECNCCSFVSCQGHIFIVSWWIKSKLVTLGNFFKNKSLKNIWLLKESSEISHLKKCDFWKWIFWNQSLVIDYHKGVIGDTSTDVTLHFEFWKS